MKESKDKPVLQGKKCFCNTKVMMMIASSLLHSTVYTEHAVHMRVKYEMEPQ